MVLPDSLIESQYHSTLASSSTLCMFYAHRRKTEIDLLNVSLREDCTLSGLSCFSIFLKLAQKPTRALLFHKHLVCGLNDVLHVYVALPHTPAHAPRNIQKSTRTLLGSDSR